jgi:tryptophan-rich sensory protein
MGFAAWLVWRRGGWRTQRLALSLFLVQLLLNALWTPLFFGWHRPDWAFFEILLLLAAISAVILLFFRCSRLAALLLAPYLAWTAFAAFLTFTIWRMNS